MACGRQGWINCAPDNCSEAARAPDNTSSVAVRRRDLESALHSQPGDVHGRVQI
jgi:hypothetical protein